MEISIIRLKNLFIIDYQRTKERTMNNQTFRELRKKQFDEAKKYLKEQEGNLYTIRILNDDLAFEITPKEEVKALKELVDEVNENNIIVIQDKKIERIIRNAINDIENF